jgi:hypothetical protein
MCHATCTSRRVRLVMPQVLQHCGAFHYAVLAVISIQTVQKTEGMGWMSSR